MSETELREALRNVTAFLDKYGLANTSGERHVARRVALDKVRAALASIPAEPEQADDVAGLDAAATQRLVMAERGRIQAGWDHWRDLLTADQNAAVAFVLYAAGEQPEMTPERAVVAQIEPPMRSVSPNGGVG